jgi:hypothetical protein
MKLSLTFGGRCPLRPNDVELQKFSGEALKRLGATP